MPGMPPKKSAASQSSALKPGAVVEYEHSGKLILGVILLERRNRWLVLNEQGSESEYPSDRLYRYPAEMPPEVVEKEAKAAHLRKLVQQGEEEAARVSLEELWELISEESREYTEQELTELLLTKDDFVHRLGLRRALIRDTIFFKRKKTTFEPRPEASVQELKVQAAVEAEKERERTVLIDALLQRLQGEPVELPESVKQLEQLAAVGSQSPTAKEAKLLLERTRDAAKLQLKGRLETQAFQLLVQAQHFSADENLAIYRFRWPQNFESKVLEEATRLAGESAQQADGKRKDIQDLLVVSIDSESTRDIDDALSLEACDSGGCRLGIHISDAAALLPSGSRLEQTALERCTSVYCPDRQIPMLPPEVSENLLSLQAGKSRFAVSIFLDLDSDFRITGRSIARTVVKVKHKLSYELVDDTLSHPQTSPLDDETLTLVQTLWKAAQELEAQRIERGAVYFSRREMNPIIHSDGTIRLEEVTDDLPGRKLVGEMMIAANETVALYGQTHALPLIFRGQETPDGDIFESTAHLPDGPAREYALRGQLKRSTTSTKALPHSSLGVEAYLHATSPIRRVADVLNQRQVCHHLETGQARYTEEQILEFLGGIEASLQEAGAIQREGLRYWLLKYLQQTKVKELGATVVRVDGRKPLAEIDTLFSLRPFNPASKDLKPGDRIKLKIQQLDPRTDTLILHQIKS